MSPIRHFKAATVALVASCLLLNSSPALAASGGDGGGSAGGAKAGGAPPAETQAYPAPWKVLPPDTDGPGGPFGLLWFPISAAETKDSSLLTSKVLLSQSARCVTMVIVEPDNFPVRTKFEIPPGDSSVVLVDFQNEVLARFVPSGDPISAGPIERMVQAELDRRETDLKAALEAANQKIKQKDVDAAVALLTPIWEQRCVVPDLGKKAAKALKKIGHPVEVGGLLDRDGRLPGVSTAMNAQADRDAAAHR
jgi:hypothetical protein